MSEVGRPPLHNETNLVLKRRAVDDAEQQGFNKRFKGAVKLQDEDYDDSASSEASSSSEESDGEEEVLPWRVYHDSAFHAIQAAVASGRQRKLQNLSTRPLLESMVSSHHSDVYRCNSITDSYLVPPYACHYTNAAKRGDGLPLLAVATEQGTIHIINTARREDWDYELPRQSFQPHLNGVFEVRFSSCDERLATASGDHASRVLCTTTGAVLNTFRGHSSTIKTIAWDPTHRELMSTGGRDGALCVWDLRLPGGAPSLVIAGAHDTPHTGKKRAGSLSPRTVTSIVYPEGFPNGIVTSGSFDGALRFWDLRSPIRKAKGKKKDPAAILKSCLKTHLSPQNAYASMYDPTTLAGSHRPRGLTSMSAGAGPTARLLFALGVDSRVHTYSMSAVEDEDEDVIPDSNMLLALRPDFAPPPAPEKRKKKEIPALYHRAAGTPTLTPTEKSYGHPEMLTNSFYVRASTSPCGRWLAAGCVGKEGKVFLYDISRAGSPYEPLIQPVQLRGHNGEVGGLDWSGDSLATCADDGVVRIWRSNVDARRMRDEAPEDYERDWAGAVGV